MNRRLLLVSMMGMLGILSPLWGEEPVPPLPTDPAPALNAVGRFLARNGGLVRRREFKIGSITVREPLTHSVGSRLPAGGPAEAARLQVTAVMLTAARPEGEETVYGICLRKPETRRKLGACRYLDLDEGAALVAALPLLQQQSTAPAAPAAESAPCSFSTRSRLRFTLVQTAEQKAVALNCGDPLMPRVILLRPDDLTPISRLVQKALLKLQEKGAP